MKLPDKINLQKKEEVSPPEIEKVVPSPGTKTKKFLPSLKKFLPKIKLPNMPKSAKITLLVLLGLLLFLILVTGVFALSIKKQTRSISSSVSQIATSIQEKDLVTTNQHLDELESNINKIESSYKMISWLKFVPL